MIMRIEIERFGPIEKFDYDLDKDLIITYGNNNIGKSYSMQIVYLLLKTFLAIMDEYPFFYFTKNSYFSPHASFERTEKELEDMVQDFITSGESIKIVTNKLTQEVYRNLENTLLPEFMNSCNNTFGNLEKTLEKTPMIRVTHDDFTFEINLKEKKIQGTQKTKDIRLKRTESDFHKSRNYKNTLDIYVVSDIHQPVSIMLMQIRKNLKYCIQSIQLQFNDVYFLPASRSGIYSGMNAFGSIVAELSKNRAYFTKKIEFPGISEPISDYFISLSRIKSRPNEGLSSYYSEIEDTILKGKVTFDKNKNALMYTPQNMDVSFEMTEVSSMVSEISPIVAFLKYIISSQLTKVRRGKTILFIEEPEAHLHPNNQIALIETFSKLVHANVKLIMSSHSNYIFNKLNNLVLSGKLNYQIYQPIILLDEGNGSRSKQLPIDELGAEDENFIDVSEKLYAEREEIIRQITLEE